MSDSPKPQLDPAAQAVMNGTVDAVRRNTVSISLERWAANTRDLILSDPKKGKELAQLVIPRWNNEGALIFGSGPSLLDYGRRLKEITLPIFAGATNTSWLLRQGRAPDVIVISDSNPILHSYLLPFREEVSSIPIVLPTVADPVWRRDPIGLAYYYYVPYVPAPDNTPTDLLEINRFLRGLTPELPAWIMQSGCVSNTSLILLQYLSGNWPLSWVGLLGVDYSIPMGEEHAPRRVPIYFSKDRRDTGCEPGPFLPRASQRAPFKGQLSSIQDIMYAMNTLIHVRDLDFSIVNLSGEKSILNAFMPGDSLTRVLDKGTTTWARRSKDERHSLGMTQLDAFLKAAAPPLQSLQGLLDVKP